MASLTLQQELQLRAAHISADDLLQLLGYKCPSTKHRERLANVLNDPMLGFRRSAFDFRYGNRAFVLALADVLGVDRTLAKAALAHLRLQLEADETEFTPNIWIDTGFKRSTQPLFALAVCEHLRTISLSETELAHYRELTMSERVRWISRLVTTHYQVHQGKLGIWGTIQRYVYCFEKERALILLPNGEVREEIEQEAVLPLASLRLRGKSINTAVTGDE